MGNCGGVLSVLFLTLFPGGCGLLLPPMNPVTHSDRKVGAAVDPQKQIIFRSEGIKFPDGVYELEVENEVYYYFAAPEKLEYRTFGNDGTTSSTYHYTGGLFFTKSMVNLVPGGAYYTVNDNPKVHFWKLGSEFIREKGHSWDTTY